MQPTKTKINLKTFFYAFLWIAVICAGLFVIVVRPLQIRNQKAQFDKAEASLDAIALQIQDKIGKADEIKKEKSCGRANQTIGEGSLGCSSSVNILYRNKNLESANLALETISSTVSKSELYDHLGRSEIKNFTPSQPGEFEQSFSQPLVSFSSVTCTANYTFPKMQHAGNVFQNLGTDSFEIELSCGGPAFKEYYPLK